MPIPCNGHEAQQEVLNSVDAGKLMAVDPGTLASWRSRGIGPPYIKMPGAKGAVRYYRGDIEQFLARHRHVPSVLASMEKIRGL